MKRVHHIRLGALLGSLLPLFALAHQAHGAFPDPPSP